MADDPLDSFFENLSAKEGASKKFQVIESSSDSDVEKKVKAFVFPDENDEKQDQQELLGENEPEYILAPDHSKIDYPAFQRDFTFDELRKSLLDQPESEIEQYLESNDIFVANSEVPPLKTFEPFILKKPSIATLFISKNIDKPTPVQAQTIPIAFNGQDTVVISPTGTGKTLAFLIPIFFRVLKQKSEAANEGPIALILSPTEILAHQTALVFHQLIKDEPEIRSVELTSGFLKFKQENSLVKGVDVIIATPGRLIQFLQSINWINCVMVVVDEADRIMESGFFRQLRSILDYIRPDRQTLFFGATLPPQIAELSHNSLKSSARVQIGRTGAPQKEIEHTFVVLDDASKKRQWILENVANFETGQVLIFVKDKSFCEKLYNILKEEITSIGYVHGQQDKKTREETFNRFRFGKIRFLISTDIAARGIDIANINTVVNADVPDKPQNYIHRVGRTARAGRSGTAYTLLTPRDAPAADSLLQHFIKTGMDPPDALIDFVNDHPKQTQHFDFDF